MKLNEVEEGDVLYPDGGFTCMNEGDQKIVHANDDGDLYVPCSDGKHFLDGQVGEDGHLVGLQFDAP